MRGNGPGRPSWHGVEPWRRIGLRFKKSIRRKAIQLFVYLAILEVPAETQELVTSLLHRHRRAHDPARTSGPAGPGRQRN